VVSITEALFLKQYSNLFLQLELLPDELIQLILANLPSSDLKSVSLVSRDAYSLAAGFLWRNVTLVDTRTCHARGEQMETDTDGGEDEKDEHDDTPMIQKLFVLAR